MSLVTTKEPADRFEDDGYSNEHAGHVAVRNHEMLMQHHRFLNTQNQPAFEQTLGSNVQIAPQCRIVSFDFKMWVNPPAPDNQRHEALHVCTALPHDAQRAATPLEQIPNWRSLYPALAPQGEDTNFDYDLIFIESKLDLMTDSPPTGSRLGIDFFARIANGSAYEVWDYATAFYEKGRRVHDCSGELRFDVEGNSECVGTTRLEMSLESSWWVKFFFKASERRRVREARGDLDALQQVNESTRRSLKEMSIMQEIWATSYANNLPRKRVAVLLWKFRQVRPGEAATTRWRDLIPPPPRITTNSPAPAMLESQMTLDASINSHMHQPVPLYTDPFHQPSFESFADCPDPSSKPQDFDDYPTPGDAFPVQSVTMDYSVSNIEVKQEDLGSVDFSEGHINLYCESYSQPPPTYGHVHFEPMEGMQEGYDGDEWAAMCAHPGFADVGFEHGNAPHIADRSEHGGGDFPDVGFEHANFPNGAEKLEHDSEELNDVGFQHDNVEQVAGRSDHGAGDYPDVGFEHPKLPEAPKRLEHDGEDFTDVGFQHEAVPQVADGEEHDSHHFTDAHSQYVDFTQALQNARRGNEPFIDGSLEQPNARDLSEKSPHGNDAFTDIGFQHAHSPEVPETQSHTTDVFTDVGFEQPHLSDVPAKPAHETDDFTDIGFEHSGLPDLSHASQHDNDSDYEHIQVQDYAMSFD